MSHKGYRPRTWIICSNRWYSAITAYALHSASALAEQGCDVVFSPLETAPACQKATELGLNVVPFGSFGIWSLGRYLRTLAAIDPEVIICFGGPETFLSLLRRVSGKSKLFRFRGQDSDVSGKPGKLALIGLDGLIFPSESLYEAWQPLPIAASVVPYGCPPPKARAEPLVSQREDRPTFLMVGRLDPIKGHRELLASFRKLLDRWPPSSPRPLLKFVGQSANLEVAEIEAAARSLNLKEGSDWQIRSDRVPNMFAEMAAADVGIIASLGSEVICRVGVEFLMSGVPIVVSGVGSLEELLVPGSGFSYRGQKLEDRLDDILELLHQPSGVRTRRAEDARANYSLQKMGERLLSSIT